MRKRRGRALRRRYGRSSHPLFPRLVMYLEKISPTHFVVKGKLQKHYGGEWHSAVYNEYPSVQRARAELHHVADVVAAENGVPPAHIEYST